MAFLKIKCQKCNHEFYRIYVDCDRELDLTCPIEDCGFINIAYEIIEPANNEQALKKCKHNNPKNPSPRKLEKSQK